MRHRRVVVTGVGVVSAIGGTRDAFWTALAGGQCGIGPLSSVDPASFHFKKAAEVRNFDPAAVIGSKLVKQTDRFAQLAMVASHHGLADAGIDLGAVKGDRWGVILGSTIGGQDTQEESFAGLYREGQQRVHPATILKIMPNAGVSQITIAFGISGPSYTVSAACSSSNFAIGQAYWLLRSGVIDGALAGGSDAPFSFGNLKAWDAMRVVSPDTCRPFSTGRDGMTIGEGGGILVLETAESAANRGARILAEIVGFGMSSDAFHIVQPSSAGAAKAIRAALNDAGVPPSDVQYVNAHGTGTEVNDTIETAALSDVFGEHTARVAVSSTKSMHGHALGAAGALEAVATVLTLEKQFIPPTINFLGKDSACDLDVVANTGRAAAMDIALSNSFAFGGLNAVLAFRRWQEQA